MRRGKRRVSHTGFSLHKTAFCPSSTVLKSGENEIKEPDEIKQCLDKLNNKKNISQPTF
jgi:hypothetical protein